MVPTRRVSLWMFCTFISGTICTLSQHAHRHCAVDQSVRRGNVRSGFDRAAVRRDWAQGLATREHDRIDTQRWLRDDQRLLAVPDVSNSAGRGLRLFCVCGRWCRICSRVKERDRLRIWWSRRAGSFNFQCRRWPAPFTASHSRLARRFGFFIAPGYGGHQTWLLLDNRRPASSSERLGFVPSYRRVLGSFEFVSYWLISAFAFACHFSFIVISPRSSWISCNWHRTTLR